MERITDNENLNKIKTELKSGNSEIKLSSLMINDELVIGIAGSLKTLNNIKKINLDSNKITDKGVAAIAEALIVNKGLTVLILGTNFITGKGASALAENLKVNKTLTGLFLNRNKISNEGLEALSSTLKVNNTLQEMNLSHNEISDKGISSLAEALKINSNFNKLLLYSNIITDKGAISLAEALKNNSSIFHLNLSNNQITCKGATAFLEALKINNTLIELDLSNNNISDRVLSQIQKILNKNKSTFKAKQTGQIDNKEFEKKLNLNKNNDDSLSLSKYKINLNEIKFIIDPKNYRKKKIGKDQFGIFYLAEYKEKPVSVKKILIDDEEKFFYKEMQLMFSLNHVNLHNLIAYSEDEDSFYFIFRFYHHGDIWSYLNKHTVSLKNRFFVLKQIASALQILHDHSPSIIHKELRSINIFIYDETSMIVHLSDFMQSSKLNPCYISKDNHIGSLRWLAPEVLKGNQPCTSSDIYSFGILMWEILSGFVPFGTDESSENISKNILKGERPDLNLLNTSIPIEAIFLMQSCWDKDLIARPDISKIVKMIEGINEIIQE